MTAEPAPVLGHEVVGADGPGAATLVVWGELDLGTAAQFALALRGWASPLPVDRQRVLDLSGVTFIDSSGLASLMAAADAMPSIVLRRPAACVLRLLTLTRVSDRFEIEP